MFFWLASQSWELYIFLILLKLNSSISLLKKKTVRFDRPQLKRLFLG